MSEQMRRRISRRRYSAAILISNDLTGSLKNCVEHGFGQLAGESVLLARVVRGEQEDLPFEFNLQSMVKRWPFLYATAGKQCAIFDQMLIFREPR